LYIKNGEDNHLKCWHCGTELIWGGDHDLEDDETYIIVTNLSCPGCNSHVDVYYPRQEKKNEKRKRKKTRRKIKTN